jgi:uncharacterized protein YqkB
MSKTGFSTPKNLLELKKNKKKTLANQVLIIYQHASKSLFLNLVLAINYNPRLRRS